MEKFTQTMRKKGNFIVYPHKILFFSKPFIAVSKTNFKQLDNLSIF